MCFCATASFAAAGGLTLVSAAMLARKPPSTDLPLAFIPLGFAIQQAIEGLLWNSLNGAETHLIPLTLAFLFFASFWWPFFLPFSAWWMEPPGNRLRRRLLGGAAAGGALVGALIYSAYFFDPSPAEIVGDSISHTTPPWITRWFFLAYVVFISCTGLFSSRRILQVYTALSIVFLLLAGWFYLQTLISVWCFFAAVLSTVLLFDRPSPRAGTD